MTTAPTFTRAAHIAGALRLTDVQPTATRWLWPGRIPLGRVTLLVSDPGLGKSLLALDLAARVSTGAPWPDHKAVTAGRADDGDEPRVESQQVKSEETRVKSQHYDSASGSCLSTLDSRLCPTLDSRLPASVLLLTAEDDLADTIRPRLEALGADCARIFAIPAVPADAPSKDVPRTFALNRDLARLAGLLDTLPDCRLLVIDPISAYLGGTNEHGNADVQNLLGPLAALARRRNLAVLAVSHLRKKEGAAIYRTMGSLAFVAAARAAWLLAKDPAEPSRRYFLPVKNNLAPDTAGLAFTIVQSQESRVESQPPASGSCLSTLDAGLPLLRWEPDPVPITAESVLASARSPGRPDDERQHAIQWLEQRLSKGPRPTRDIKVEADVHGIGYGTLRRAFRELGCTAVRQGPFPFGKWMWKLPGVDAQNPGGEFCAPTDFVDEFIKSLLPCPTAPDQSHDS